MENFKVLQNGQVLKRKPIDKGDIWESYCNELDFDFVNEKLIKPINPKGKPTTLDDIKDLLLEVLSKIN